MEEQGAGQLGKLIDLEEDEQVKAEGEEVEEEEEGLERSEVDEDPLGFVTKKSEQHQAKGSEGDQNEQEKQGAEQDGENSRVFVKTVGGSFVVGDPVALSFEELIAMSHERPDVHAAMSMKSNSGDPLSENSQDEEESARPSAGVPVKKSEWYRPDGSVFRLGQNVEKNRRHMLYDVFFSGQSIGLTLSFDEHVYVQALTGLAAMQLGLIAKGDIIISAACQSGWMRCCGTLQDLTGFIRTNGRPIILRFWRRPEPIQLGMLLKTSGPLETFLNFLNKYMESPNYKEVMKNERSVTQRLAEIHATDNVNHAGRKRTESEQTDVDESEDEGAQRRQPPQPRTPTSASERFLNTPIAQVMFLTEVIKVRQLLKASTTTNSEYSRQTEANLRKGVASKYLQRRSSDFSIRDLLSEDQVTEEACREALESGSMVALDTLYDRVLQHVRNDSFAVFLHKRDAELALEKLGEKNAWRLRVYSQMVRRFLPLDVLLFSRRCCHLFLFYMLSLDGSSSTSDRLTALRYLVLWTVSQFGTGETGYLTHNTANLLANKADLVVPFTDCREVNQEVLKDLILESCTPYHRQFVNTDYGRQVIDAVNQAIAPGCDDQSKVDEFLPRLSSVLHSSSLADRFALHRNVQQPDNHPSDNAANIVTFALLFETSPELSEPKLIFTAGEGPVPPHVDRFFIPHGKVSDESSGFVFPTPLAFNFTMGSGLYGCSLVVPRRKASIEENDVPPSPRIGVDQSCVGVCLLSPAKRVNSLKQLLVGIYEEFGSVLETNPHNSELQDALDMLVRSKEQGQETLDGTKNEIAPSANLPALDFSLEMLFQVLSHENIVKVFECCLLERKILIVSSRYSGLTIACESLRALMHPLQWCHVYAPVLPRKMLDHLECPTPFMIGINTFFAFKRDFPFLLDAVVVDLDIGTVEIPTLSGRGSDASRGLDDARTANLCLPNHIRSELIAELRRHTQLQFQSCDSLVQPGERAQFPEEEVRLVFQHVVEQLVGNLTDHCVPVLYETSEMESVMLFDETSFLKTLEPVNIPFYQAFLQTQAVSTYVASFIPEVKTT